MNDLYERDILIWSEEQAALLQRVSVGEFRGSDQVDWPKIIEEIRNVGRRELLIVESYLILALVHHLMVAAWPLSPHAQHWRDEARSHRMDARRAFVPSMRPRINLASLYSEALGRMPPPPSPLPSSCPITLDELLDD
jgi:hypothetical protein